MNKLTTLTLTSLLLAPLAALHAPDTRQPHLARSSNLRETPRRLFPTIGKSRHEDFQRLELTKQMILNENKS
jgi:hypothetical protein